jgi:hypothetical protein
MYKVQLDKVGSILIQTTGQDQYLNAYVNFCYYVHLSFSVEAYNHSHISVHICKLTNSCQSYAPDNRFHVL